MLKDLSTIPYSYTEYSKVPTDTNYNSTDIGMLFIILRILSVLRLPLGRLIFTSFLLGSGIFVAVCALIRVILVVYNLGNHAKRGIWGGRELLVAIIVVNLPVIKPLFNKTSWFSKPPSNADLSSPSRV